MRQPASAVALPRPAADLPDAAFCSFCVKETSMVSKPNLASPQDAVFNAANSAVLTAASQTIIVLLEAGRIARLPEGTDISDPVQQGADLQFRQSDGSVVLIPGGAVADLVLYVGDVEIPAQTVAVLLGDSEIEVGRGFAGGAHGNFEDPAAGDIGEAFVYSELLEATDEPAAGGENDVAVLANQLVDEDDSGFASLLIWWENNTDRIELLSISDEATSTLDPAPDTAAADYVTDIEMQDGDFVDLSPLLAGPGQGDPTGADPATPDPGAICDVIDITVLFDNLSAPADTF
jgi:hypothetical protein